MITRGDGVDETEEDDANIRNRTRTVSRSGEEVKYKDA